MVTISTILVANVIGILEDPNQLQMQRRIAICESLAINCSLHARENKTRSIASSIKLLSDRNPDIQSAALRRKNGEIIYQQGDHEKHWRPRKDGAKSKDSRDNIMVPILNREQVWGSVEVAFGETATGWKKYLFINRFPILALTLFCALLNGLAIYWYLRRTLSYLDPSQSVPDRVRTALDTLAEGLLVLDTDYRIVLANKTFATNMGYEPLELQGKSADDLPWWLVDQSKDEMPWRATGQSMEKHTGAKIGLSTAEGDRIFLVNTSPIDDGSGESRGVLVSFDDITELESKQLAMQSMLGELRRSRTQIQERNRELRLLATRDPLTGCLNRRTFFESFDRQWSLAARHKRELCCLMLDIDFFKSINDNHGHSAGDEVLRRVAKALQDGCRNGDMLCRYGGEEFCIVMPETTLDECEVFANRIRESVEATNMDIEGLNVTISIGASSTATGATEAQLLLDEADKSLYIAKRNGRNRVCRWDDIADQGDIEKVDLPRTDEEEKATDESFSIPYRAVTSLIAALGARDPATAAHSTRVAELCVLVARGLMTVSDTYQLEIAALLHDVGKIGVPDSILHKAGALNQSDWQVMMAHDRIGIDIVEASLESPELVELIRCHRLKFKPDEQLPDVPKQEDIPLGARILTIADAYDSMVTARAYRTAMTQEQAFEELQRCAGTQFDPRLVERFIAVVEDFTHIDRLDVNSKQTAIQFGSQMEELAVAFDGGDITRIRDIANRLHTSAATNNVTSIEKMSVSYTHLTLPTKRIV